MIKFLVSLAFVVSCVISASAQCGDLGCDFERENPRYYWTFVLRSSPEDSTKPQVCPAGTSKELCEWRLFPVDHIEAADLLFSFTFRLGPDPADPDRKDRSWFYINDYVNLEIAPYGREKRNFSLETTCPNNSDGSQGCDPNGCSSPSAKDNCRSEQDFNRHWWSSQDGDNSQRRSQIPAEMEVAVGRDQPSPFKTAPEGPIYAILCPETDSNYLLPARGSLLTGDQGTIQAEYIDWNGVRSTLTYDAGHERRILRKKSYQCSYRRLEGTRLNSKGVMEGDYWMTLQQRVSSGVGDAVWKTTPPVLINARGTPTPVPSPSVSFDLPPVTADCNSLDARINVKYSNNVKDQSPASNRTMVTWSVKRVGSEQYIAIPNEYPTDRTTLKITGAYGPNNPIFPDGEYEVTVTVSDPEYIFVGERTRTARFTTKLCRLPPELGSCEYVYFRFDQTDLDFPMTGREGSRQVRFYPDFDLTKDPKECKSDNPALSGPFDESSGLNLEKLAKVVRELRNYRDYNVTIFAQADFKGPGTLSVSRNYNDCLGCRRALAVKRYIDSQLGPKEPIRTNVVLINRGNRNPRSSKDPDNYSTERILDRRATIVWEKNSVGRADLPRCTSPSDTGCSAECKETWDTSDKTCDDFYKQPGPIARARSKSLKRPIPKPAGRRSRNGGRR